MFLSVRTPVNMVSDCVARSCLSTYCKAEDVTGITATLFKCAARMWYEDGSIKYEIEGQESGDLGPVGNPYRLIKYLVIRPSRSGSFTMVDLRILQLSVTSNCRVPTEEAVEYTIPIKTANSNPEHTIEAFNEVTLTPSLIIMINEYLNTVIQSITTWWTVYWPQIHFEARNPITQAVLLHMSIDIIANTEVYSSNSANANDEDLCNFFTMAGFACSLGLWQLALLIACAVAENAILGGMSAVILTMVATLGYAWNTSNLLVENCVTAAGAMAGFFLVLGASYIGMAVGLKGVGNMTSNLLSRILGYLLGISEESIKAALVFTRATRVIFIIIGVIFMTIFFHAFLQLRELKTNAELTC